MVGCGGLIAEVFVLRTGLRDRKFSSINADISESVMSCFNSGRRLIRNLLVQHFELLREFLVGHALLKEFFIGFIQ